MSYKGFLIWCKNGVNKFQNIKFCLKNKPFMFFHGLPRWCTPS
nr:MAG TPA: hypothetical protein [Caudoviricetes sp.]